ncbi:response regulator [Tenacibaculum agarivorans]|uniref:response regulator n=1 Tax=Tenacibaculum agarivorans TaxID=1908389 RepID=UPI00094B852F|nr:response regulator [Tenacibaculum agarivorans]
MSAKINTVLLVDDDKATNFIHELIIKDNNYCNKIVTKYDGEEAIEFLESAGDNDIPDIVFLDINMPKVDGWEFLKKYKELPEHKRAQIVVVMLTTSLNANDKERAISNELISEFRNKPLTKEMLADLEEKYFKND